MRQPVLYYYEQVFSVIFYIIRCNAFSISRQIESLN